MKYLVVFLFLVFCAISNINAQQPSIILLSPLDNATNVQTNPIFHWQTIGINQPNIQYTFKLAEYTGNVSEQTAINQNQIYTNVVSSNNYFNTLIYPNNLSQSAQLKECSTYVWQVTATYTTYTTSEPIVPLQTYTYNSEIFQFSTPCSTSTTTSNPISNNIYIQPKKQIDNFVHLITTETLYIKYDEKYNNNQIEYKIYTSKDNIVASSTQLSVQFGLNYISIPIADLNNSSPANPIIYTLELKTPKGDILRTKFEKKIIQ